MKKICTICNVEKDITEFSVNKALADGYTKDCLVCRNAKNKKYREENREKERLRYKKYGIENKSKINAKNKKWYENNYILSEQGRSRVRERQSIYRQSELGSSTKKNLEGKRRALILGTYEYNAKDKVMNLRKSSLVCYYCGEFLNKMHIDHFYPLAKGGSHVAHNLVASCPTCNLKKKDKNPFVFINQMQGGICA